MDRESGSNQQKPPEFSWRDRKPPTRAGSLSGCGRKVRALYRKIPWDLWWEEFTTATTADGKLKYPTSFAFCQAKAPNKTEAMLVYAMVGPHCDKAKATSGKLKVPWLGDWQEKRALSFWSSGHVWDVRLAQAASESQLSPADVVHFVRPYIVVSLERYARLAEKIDEAFGGEPFLPDLSPTAPRNLARVSAFCKMHRHAFRMQQGAIEELLRNNGLQALASYGLAVLRRHEEEAGGRMPVASKVTESDLRLAQELARAGDQSLDFVW